MKRILICIFAAMLMLSALAGCGSSPVNSADPGNTSTQNNTSSAEPDNSANTPIPANNTSEPDSYDPAEWFCPFYFSPQPLSPAKIINIKTGEVLVACTDPLCDHSKDSKTCFYNFDSYKTTVCSAEYTEGHIVFIAEKETPKGYVMKLYDFDIAQNRMEEAYTFEYLPDVVWLRTDHKRVFFPVITYQKDEADENKIIGLFSYDPSTKDISLIEDNIQHPLYYLAYDFRSDHYIYPARYSEKTDILTYCRCYYDGSSEEFFESMPDGTAIKTTGWCLHAGGLFANTGPNGGVYVEEDKRYVMYPTDSATSSPVRYKDNFYFQPASAKSEKLGRKPDGKDDVWGYRVDNEIYVLNKNGSYKRYFIDCKYHFTTVAVYENIVMGRIEYSLSDDGVCIKGTSPDIIRIDLDTGEATVYDTSWRRKFVCDTFTVGITLNEN